MSLFSGTTQSETDSSDEASDSHHPGVFTLLIWWNYVLQDRGANFRAFETIYFKLTKKIRKNYKNSKKFKIFMLKNTKKNVKHFK